MPVSHHTIIIKQSVDDNTHVDFDKTDLYDFHNHTLLCYKGPFDGHMLASMGNSIRSTLSKNSLDAKRVFAIFIELAQNVSNYSFEKVEFAPDKQFGVGTIVVDEYHDHYKFITGNRVSKNDANKLIEKCTLVNTLDRQGLHEFKRMQWRLPRMSRGANIGLIQIAITSENPLGVTVTPIDELSSFFTLCVTINKTTTNNN